MKREFDYNQWRLNKIREIIEQEDCSRYEASLLFLLQDISYKLNLIVKGQDWTSDLEKDLKKKKR